MLNHTSVLSAALKSPATTANEPFPYLLLKYVGDIHITNHIV